MSPFVCLFKPVVYGLYAGAQLTEYGGDLFLFVGRNEPFAFAAGEVEAAAPDEVDEVKKILDEEMKGAADLSVELEIDTHTGKNWYEAK